MMTTDGGTCQLKFPLDFKTPLSQELVLRDLDVVGVGSLRRFQIEELLKNHHVVLRTHENFVPQSVFAIYQEELLHTLQWLRPQRQDSCEHFDFLDEQRQLFTRLFPKTIQTLGVAATKIRDAYLKEMEWSSWLLQDHWRYFPGFLRQKFSQNKDLFEVTHWEWVQAWLEVQPFSLPFADPGTLVLNPSLQIVSLTSDKDLLNRSQGIYAVIYQENQHKIIDRKLEACEAHLFDLLSEDRKYTFSQLIEMACLNDSLGITFSSEKWALKLSSLCADGFILGDKRDAFGV